MKGGMVMIELMIFILIILIVLIFHLAKEDCQHIWKVFYTKEGSVWSCLKCGKKRIFKSKGAINEVKSFKNTKAKEPTK